MKKIIKNNFKVPWLRLVVVLYALVLIIGAWPTDVPYFVKGHAVGTLGRWALVAFGIIVFWCGVLYKYPKRGKNFTRHEQSICPKCQKVYLAGQAPADAKCEPCGISLEPLEGFYKRHPELKDSPEEFTQSEKD
ncbi:hypothetical protein [Maridesulfovibrio sp. FT414]|uniref:hypothetical protein n=1 Tax=Maridesulfovibrio sp. FT414 TaxID=2979469 RepID=UPI003D809454